MNPLQALAFLYQNLQNISTTAQNHDAFKQAVAVIENALKPKE